MPFFDKELSKTIMTRTKLENKSEENRKPYIKQRNFCVSLLRKVKKTYYETVNEKSAIDNKPFLKTVKSFLFDKILGENKIHLTENGELIKTDLKAAEILFFFLFFKLSTNS